MDSLRHVRRDTEAPQHLPGQVAVGGADLDVALRAADGTVGGARTTTLAHLHEHLP